MFGIKTKKLTKEQLDKAEMLGEKVGTFLFRRGEAIRRINSYVLKHRFVVLPAIVVVAFAITILGFFWSPKDYPLTSLPSVITKIPVEVKATQDNYGQLLSEYQLRLDSVQYLLKRGNLSYEDSIYIATTAEYINHIKQ